MNRIVIYPGADHVFQSLFKDVETLSHVVLVRQMFVDAKIESSIDNLRIHTRRYKYAGQLSKFFYDKKINYISHLSSGDVVVFSNISIRYVSYFKLMCLKMKGVKIVLFFLDSLSNHNAKEAYIYSQRIHFDLIYTFDSTDAKEHNFVFRDSMYSELAKDHNPETVEYDVYFNGSDKGRYDILKDFIKRYNHLKILSNMICISDIQRDEAGIMSNTSVDYEENVKRVKESNCILDIVIDPNQTGLSLRAYEAVVYNKKLITNNPSILSFRYYNPHYMLYTKDFVDIDEHFMQNKEHVDYGYMGDFSPIDFIDDIKTRL